MITPEAYERFRKALVRKSISEKYDDAVQEWSWHSMRLRKKDELPTCICKKSIKYIYLFKHKTDSANRKMVRVGSTCFSQFLKDQGLLPIYQEIKRILISKGGAKADELIQFGTLINVISYNQGEFMKKIMNFKPSYYNGRFYRNPSRKQAKYYRDLLEQCQNAWKIRTKEHSIKYINKYVK